MSRIVFGAGASHTTLMNTQWQKVDHLPRAHAFRDALHLAGAQLAASRPDVVVIVGSNHFRGFWLDLMPAFTIGVDRIDSSGEHGTPSGVLKSDPAFARHICQSLMASGFDPAFSTNLAVDHGISHAVQWIVGADGPPIVPIVINCFAPPLPALDRCVAFGAALRAALVAAPGARRIAVIATGGLSHQLPFPDWRRPESEDDEFLVDSWRHGRGRWQDFETRRRGIVVKAPPRLNERFDRDVLDTFAAGSLPQYLSALGDEALTAQAGNGAAELRGWLVMAAATGNSGGETVAYAPMPEWLTGMAVAIATVYSEHGETNVDMD